MVASESLKEKDLQMEEHQKDAKALKALYNEVVNLKSTLYDALQNTM